MVRNHRGQEPILSSTQLDNGFRVVDGEVLHLDDLYRNKYEKLREFIKSVPYTQSNEQIEVLQSGKFTTIERAMEISIRMSQLALEEYEKLRKKKLASTLKDMFMNRKAKELDRMSMHEEFYQHEQEMRDMRQLWQKSFDTACRINSRKVGITSEQFDELVMKFAEDETQETVDSFLPTPQ